MNATLFNKLRHPVTQIKRWNKKRLEKPLNDINQRYHIANVIMADEENQPK